MPTTRRVIAVLAVGSFRYSGIPIPGVVWLRFHEARRAPVGVDALSAAKGR